jgi:hypothetical protein
MTAGWLEVFSFNLYCYVCFLPQINGVAVNLPYSSPLYSVYFSGGFVRYQTTFGLAVETDGSFVVHIFVPSTYRSLLNGLCGNFDGVSTNDLVYNNTDYSSNPRQFGDFYIFPETTANGSTYVKVRHGR